MNESGSTTVSIKDVARHAGVSVGTVSLGLRDDPRVKARTRLLVQSVARQMSYRPKASARSLANNRTYTMGLVFGDGLTQRTNLLAMYAPLIRAFAAELTQRRYSLILTPWDDKPEQPGQVEHSLPRIFRESGIEAIMVLGTPSGPQLEQLFREQDLTYVAVDSSPAPGRVTVAVDESRAVELAVEHLLHLGHRRIAYIPTHASEELGPYISFRRGAYPRGYARAMVAAGLMPVAGWDKPSHPGFDYGRAVEQLLAGPDPPTALITYDVLQAVAYISFLASRNIRVPEDVSVVALHPLGTYTRNVIANIYQTRGGVTCMKDMQDEMAKAAVEKILEIKENTDQSAESVLLEPELLEAGSSGPCPGSKA